MPYISRNIIHKIIYHQNDLNSPLKFMRNLIRVILSRSNLRTVRSTWRSQGVSAWCVGWDCLQSRRTCCTLRSCTCNALQFRMRPSWFFFFFSRLVRCCRRRAPQPFFRVWWVWWWVRFFRSWVILAGWWGRHWRGGACSTRCSSFAVLTGFFHRFSWAEAEVHFFMRGGSFCPITFRSYLVLLFSLYNFCNKFL